MRQANRRYVIIIRGKDRRVVARGLNMCLATGEILMGDMCGEWDKEEFSFVAHIAVATDTALDCLRSDLKTLGEKGDCDIKLQDLDVSLGLDALSYAEPTDCEERNTQQTSLLSPEIERTELGEDGQFRENTSPLDSPDLDRRLLACELHDGPIQQLTGALFCFDGSRGIRDIDADEAKISFDRGFQLLAEGIAGTRRLLTDLEAVDERADVAVAVDRFISDVRANWNAGIELIIEGDFESLAPSLQWAILRITQEAVRNALKHSSSHTIRVTIMRLIEHVWINVRDWGRGFKPQEGHGFGLRGIQLRSKLLGGHSTVISRPDYGTKVTVTLPVTRPSGGNALGSQGTTWTDRSNGKAKHLYRDSDD